MKPYEIEKMPYYFEFEDKKYKRISNNVFFGKINGKEFETSKKNNQAMEALGAGKIITEEEYEKGD